MIWPWLGELYKAAAATERVYRVPKNKFHGFICYIYTTIVYMIHGPLPTACQNYWLIWLTVIDGGAPCTRSGIDLLKMPFKQLSYPRSEISDPQLNVFYSSFFIRIILHIEYLNSYFTAKILFVKTWSRRLRMIMHLLYANLEKNTLCAVKQWNYTLLALAPSCSLLLRPARSCSVLFYHYPSFSSWFVLLGPVPSFESSSSLSSCSVLFPHSPSHSSCSFLPRPAHSCPVLLHPAPLCSFFLPPFLYCILALSCSSFDQDTEH